MASSDEEDFGPQSVTNYYFVEGKEVKEHEPVSFSVLPVLFDGAEKPAVSDQQVFLQGDADGGLQKFYKQVIAWKLGMEDSLLDISVLTKDKKWVKLLKPRKSYEGCIKTILVTVQLLHYLRRHPDSSEKSLWQHLRKVSSFEEQPSVSDLKDHYPLIQMFVERDDSLSKSQLLLTLLAEKPTKKMGNEDIHNDYDAKKPFIVDDFADVGMMDDDDGDESDEESDLFDSVCAICDNGGELLCCEGRCMRSFHATKQAGEDSDCKSLGFTSAQVEAIQNFLCKNCEFKRHQCFACGKLGSSDKTSAPEVFQCANATCGYFYHPKCAADLLFPDSEIEASQCCKTIADGQSFTCPVHRCKVCKQGENKELKDLQFAMCRRCPKAYHRKCLPRKISFEDIEEEDIIQRAWDDLLPNRILIYCLKHKIDDDLGTPIRNHIIFSADPEKKKLLDMPKKKQTVPLKTKHVVSANLVRDKGSQRLMKATEELSRSVESHKVVKTGKSVTNQVLNIQKQLKPLKETAQPEKRKAAELSSVDIKKKSKESMKASVPPVLKSSLGKSFTSSHPEIDSETENKIAALVQKASSSVKLEDIIKKRAIPSTHAYAARNIDKSITLGKVEQSVEAMRTALQKVEANGSIEDAKAYCEPGVLRQMNKWNNKLKVYLSPFLHGLRYTSYGRHFTKVDKLKEIVDKLQWYVEDGDTIVDFCCGANDFSILMKETLDARGKKCSYRNFDVVQPKKDFNFERRDWMTVQPHELPNGKNLIMGLNPPFGVKASLANKFIDKALTFKPKLIILIVPPETERLDRKSPPYDIIWEDANTLSGRSFYLPGSVDCNDKQMEQWNQVPPPLYLWSRRDWTSKHKIVAEKQGHISKPKYEDLGRNRSDDDIFKPEEARERRSGDDSGGRARTEAVNNSEEVAIERNDEGNNKKHETSNLGNSRKRSPPKETNASRSAKKRKVKRTNQEASERRNDVARVTNGRENSDMSISPPQPGNPSRDFEAVSSSYRDERTINDNINATHSWSNNDNGHLDHDGRCMEDRNMGYINQGPYVRFGGPSPESWRQNEDPLPRPHYSLGNHDPGYAAMSHYGLPGPARGSPAMQRYASQFDEANYAMIGSRNSGPGLQPSDGRSSAYDMHSMMRDALPPRDPYTLHRRGSGGFLDN